MNTLSQNSTTDSDMTRDDILKQNPKNPAPHDVLDLLDIFKVEYYGFDGMIHAGQIVLNKNVIEDVKTFFKTALVIKFPIQKIIPISSEAYKWDDETSCNDNNSSGYNFRYIMGTNRMSKHAHGLAFDINPVQNIYVRYDEHMKEIYRCPQEAIYKKDAVGTLTHDHPLVILMKNLGWIWGGDWTPESGRVDYQHFEKKCVMAMDI